MKFIIGLLMAMSAAQSANASSLFYDKCEEQSSSLSPAIVLVSDSEGIAGLSCQDIKSTFEAAKIVGIALMPASLALRTPGVREGIAADLETLGLTLSNPAILGVTVLGSVGVATVYLVMKSSLEECQRLDRERLKQELLRELRESYPGSTGRNVPLDIHNDGHAQ